MEITLEKIDQVVTRTGVTYSQAKEALETTNGDIIEALIYIEKNTKVEKKNINEVLNEKTNELLDNLKDVLKKGNVTKVIVEKEGDVVLNLPVTVGVLGLVLAPIAALIGASAAVVTNYKIKIVKDDGGVIDLNEMTEEKINMVKNKVNKNKNSDLDNDKNCTNEDEEDDDNNDENSINLDK